jgi:hypothetical protein
MLLLSGILLLLVAGCSAEKPTSPSPAEDPSNPISPSPTTPIPPADSNPSAGSAESTQTPDNPNPATLVFDPPSTLAPVLLNVVAPIDGSLLEVGFVRIMGTTSGTSINIDGVSAVVDETGRFQGDLDLDPGENSIKVAASDDVGLTTSQTIRVTVAEPQNGLPFTVLFPPDGFESSVPRVTLVGVTTPDAAVGVNGNSVDVNEVGIFSTTVDLDQGDNFLEVTGADIQGNARSKDVTVFLLQ